MTSPELDLTERQFRHVRERLYALAGINLLPGKEGLVRARLGKRLRALGLATFEEYLDRVEGDASGRELRAFIDALTTNKTSFFREPQHFDFLAARVLPACAEAGRARIWSAGCSSGEEAYTIAMVMRETIPDVERMDARVLATDISERVLARAREGVYEHELMRDVPVPLARKYFACVRQEAPRAYRAGDALRALVRFARLNLMEAWPMRGPFDAIFCRNVMIYFDRPTQERLVGRFWELLAPGGHLFVGHSESLTALDHRFRYVQPAVYVR
jgi:chemotaxis protein methyltransferase CheR